MVLRVTPVKISYVRYVIHATTFVTTKTAKPTLCGTHRLNPVNVELHSVSTRHHIIAAIHIVFGAATPNFVMSASHSGTAVTLQTFVIYIALTEITTQTGIDVNVLMDGQVMHVIYRVTLFALPADKMMKITVHHVEIGQARWLEVDVIHVLLLLLATRPSLEVQLESFV